ncbi:phosphate regulon sensor protein PhoR [Pseudanabaena sp. lw0831]|uniref:PAS domain-containing sensor histidine kinase n=1 Tax=Pseudanabaena sp. lw0831 TaxID=1357935 RepID=UPI001A23C7A9|nr:PAS domain-containing sensor histidine kinase [Pseudanabaena sp. lw0831]GBO56651.1 phosphate regulon sensor protein PhoR [Pseudanabaena sp. lw0831]
MELLWLLVGICLGAIATSACWFSWNYAKQRRNRKLRKRSRHVFKAKSIRSFKSWAKNIQQNIRQNYNNQFNAQFQLIEHKEDRGDRLLWGKIVELSPIGYIQVDQDNRLTVCNQQAASMMGIANHQKGLIRKPFLLQLIRSYELDHLVELTRSLAQGSQVDWVFHPAIPDPVDPVPQIGRPIRACSIYLGQGQVGIFLIDRQESVAITQQRDRWTSDIAHELKTPLTSIRLVAETLEPRVDPAARIWVERLLSEIDRITKLVQDLLELGQMDVGVESVLHLSEVNLSSIVRSVWVTLEPLANRKQVKLKYIGNELFWQLDESRIYRLLLNLLDNSIKHSPALQSITIKTSVIDSNLQIEIIDAGEGFPEESLPHIFDRFYKVDPSRTRSGTDRGGSGLGLAISRQIVTLHKGSIAAKNHPETGGVWITITLPYQNPTK